MEQLHKKFEDYQVKELICRYLTKEIERIFLFYLRKVLKNKLIKIFKKFA